MEYAQWWYGQVRVRPQLPAGSKARPEARCLQLFKNPFSDPSCWRMTTTRWYPIVPVMKSPGSSRSSVSPSHTHERPNTRTISRSNSSWSYTSQGWTKSVGSGDRTSVFPSATRD